MVESVYFLCATYTTAQAIWGSVPDGTGRNTPWFVSLTWCLSSIVGVVSILITILFWVLDYTPGDDVEALTVAQHGGQCVIALFDLMMSRQPIYLEHIFAPMLFACAMLLSRSPTICLAAPP
eukprot:SRR837773.19414.p2 GENE.SRR837773.19414~~SRR837773.19414.p2  ORF type:complete len:138 (+),score=17.75 SRR837773.19414:50-415(+)